MKWEVDKAGKGYILCTQGAGTAAINDKLFAILTERPPPEEWVITRDRLRSHINAYV